MARRTRKAADSTVRGEYTEGEGWNAGQRAPSTKYVDMDGKIMDKEPKGGGHVLVFAGDVVRPDIARQLSGGDEPADEADDGDES